MVHDGFPLGGGVAERFNDRINVGLCEAPVAADLRGGDALGADLVGQPAWPAGDEGCGFLEAHRAGGHAYDPFRSVGGCHTSSGLSPRALAQATISNLLARLCPSSTFRMVSGWTFSAYPVSAMRSAS